MQKNNTNNIEKTNPFEVYITKLFRAIPKNCVLITKNKFNGKNVEVKKGGFALIAPWKESKLVSLAVKNFDYPESKFEDFNGENVIIDLAVSVRVSDPIKYEYCNANVEEELKQLITSSMRVLINKSQYSNLKSTRFNVNQYVKSNGLYYKNVHLGQDGNLQGNSISALDDPLELDFVKAMCEFKDLLSDFSQKYGLEVVDLYNKKVEQSEVMQEYYNKKRKAELERQAKNIEKEGELERAKVDAEIARIKSEADAKAKAAMYKAIQEVLNNADMTSEEKAKFLQAFTFANTSSPENVASVAAAAITGATMGLTSGMSSNLSNADTNFASGEKGRRI